MEVEALERGPRKLVCDLEKATGGGGVGVGETLHTFWVN